MADWLSYDNQGATRNQPLSKKLEDALSFLPDLGVSMTVFSGGQPAAGEGPRVGSTRHDHGDAGDVSFYKDGRMLDWNNPSDIPVLSDIVARAKAGGVTGIGAGDDYMGPGRVHIGFGSPAVWGAGGKGVNAPDWLRNAYYGTAPQSPAVGAINTAAPGIMRPAATPPGGIMGGIGAGLGNLLGSLGNLGQQAAPLMRSAGQNAAPAIMRAALGSVAGRTALIDPFIKQVFNGPKRANVGSGGYDRTTGTFNSPLSAGPQWQSSGPDHTSTTYRDPNKIYDRSGKIVG